MTKRVQRYGETSGALASIIGLAREIIINTTKWTITVHDGVTEGGHEIALADASNITAATSSAKGAMSAADKSKLDDIPADFDYDAVSSASDAASPVGVVLPYAGSSAPTGWLLCNGQAVSRTTYSSLFAIVGTAFGAGDGSSTFNVPDLGGRVPVGKESSASRLTQAVSGIDSTTIGAHGGDERMHGHTHTGTTGNESATHTHGVSGTTSSDGAHTHTSTMATISGTEGALSGVFESGGGATATSEGSTISSDGAHTHTYSTTSGTESANHTHSFTTNTSGAGSSQNVQPSIVLTYIIKH